MIFRAFRSFSNPSSCCIVVAASMPPSIATMKAEAPIKILYVVSSMYPNR
ncbi:hypothetical protein [Parabacteroides massiliensis]